MVLELARRGHDVAIHYHSSAAEAEATADAARALAWAVTLTPTFWTLTRPRRWSAAPVTRWGR